MNRPLFSVLGVMAFGLAATPASASAVLFNEPGPIGCQQGCWNSTLDPTGTGYQVYAPFTLATTATVAAAQWQGLYIDLSNYDSTSNLYLGNPVGPSTTNWQIDVYANNAGVPGGLLYQGTLAAGSVTTNYLGTNSSLFNTPTNQYRFQGALPGGGYTATGGQEYWFSVVSEQPSDNPVFGWTSSNDASVDSYQVYHAPPFGDFFPDTLGNNMNFTLIGVPEPASIGLLGFALAGLGMLRRRC